MMQTNLYNQIGDVVGQIELPDEVFGLKINQDLLHQAVVAQLGNSRQVLAHTKDRSEVRGGGKKPWRQKGTGRARHGSTRSPIWKGGGVTFGPTKERNFSKNINKKMKRKALFMALSGKAQDEQLKVLDNLNLENSKTKLVNKVLRNLVKTGTLILVTPSSDKNIERSARNLSYAKVLSAKSLNVLDILNHKYLFLLKDAIPVIKEHYVI
ncbi:MAG: 50S ribosomal protein L4 [Candidatus Yanofskybacteria bacterium RIFCSPHIGHO2_02_FULL_43_15c]|uniref:Large ribosomal subunit protein uL4 n=2 Tax=Candidatus Yanofskyibacteriota TaxID=1752733 RepID=A0A1F8H1Y0_9BACT|nr:MAG: 50S ribosomal protein L4 [Candidatus Yanofskybacteria bacterium RIFCSPHIGHO2_02_FULL_43_15c]OGN30749.1 MAG: 50S ribosomal protein L4 [Candidatus Yanofskybacteria bacterium RIFCSPLOWO2_02_FULL_43_10b]